MALEDKTEAATPRKREEARKEGKVAKSNDINSALVLLAAMIIFKASGPWIMQSFMAMTRSALSSQQSAFSTQRSAFSVQRPDRCLLIADC